MAKKKEKLKEEPQKKVSKVEMVYQRYLELKNQQLKPKEIYEKISEELKISPRSARGYVWRKENPEAYKALLQRYFEKKKAKTAKAKADEENKTKAEKKEP